jgi:preprotein translocase subunit SecG
MNVPIEVAWIVVVILAVLSIIFFSGKGSILIAGFNTSNEEERKRYNLKRLCRIMGGGFSIITIILGISVFYNFELPPAIHWIIPWGILGTIAVMVILANTIGRLKKI